MKDLHKALTDHFDEVCDLYSRQLLSIVYKEAWVDVIKIVHANPPVRPIHLLAHDRNIVVRFMADERGIWSATIRPKFNGASAKIITAKAYADCERAVREYIERIDIRKILQEGKCR